ncbi:MAG: hypothetical protein MUF54_22950 [Polyangiaceae bacterium]|nr:hypothetical protein [Polyangiaceae bacterium]
MPGCFEANDLHGNARIVVPLDPSDRANDAVELAPTSRSKIAQALHAAGLREEEARRLAAGSGGRLTALQRLLGASDLPAWTREVPRAPLFAMLLVGQWEPTNSADRKVVELLGADASDLDSLCTALQQSAERPISRKEHAFKWSSPQAIWRELARGLSDSLLNQFETAVVQVLGTDDPRFELDPEERFAAALTGETIPYSAALRVGLAESLVRLAVSDDELRKTFGIYKGSRVACGILARLLRTDWKAWASLSDVLPILVEACPSVFLDRLDESLSAGDNGAAHLLVQESSFGGSPHTGLLWSVEKLAWSDDHVGHVVDVLASLAETDRNNEKASVANRPIASLHNVLHPRHPQSKTTVERRLALLENVARK